MQYEPEKDWQLLYTKSNMIIEHDITKTRPLWGRTYLNIFHTNILATITHSARWTKALSPLDTEWFRTRISFFLLFLSFRDIWWRGRPRIMTYYVTEFINVFYFFYRFSVSDSDGLLNLNFKYFLGTCLKCGGNFHCCSMLHLCKLLSKMCLLSWI